jgi:membrane-bound inhibitor of C-type lysozyme
LAATARGMTFAECCREQPHPSIVELFGGSMKRSKIFLKALTGIAALGAELAAFGAAPALAQGFQTYHCADGTEFIVGFYPYDSRAFVQIDGREITLPRRLTLSGRRYSGDDVTLKIARSGATTITHAKRREAVCTLHTK